MKVSGQLHAPAALPSVPVVLEAGWAPKPGVNDVENRKLSCPCWVSNRNSWVIQPTA
jgi:hypothetical protein